MPRRKRASRLLSTPNRNPNPSDIVTLENELFQEASRLSAATGAHIALFARRPTGEIRLWGYPSVQSVVNRYQTNPRNQIPDEAGSAPDLVRATEARARQYAELRRREEEELRGTMPSDLTEEEQGAREHVWMLEFVRAETERVRKRIEELDSLSSNDKTSAQGSPDQTGV